LTCPIPGNINDVMDDTPGYYRGIGWYKKTIELSAELKSRKIFLYFEGGQPATEVYINKIKAGSHTGGYTAFCIPVSEFLKSTDKVAEIMVKVDNSHNANIPPLSADFTFYGGIYRSVSLIATNAIHFSMNDNASQAVFISTPVVDENKAEINIKGSFTNAGAVTNKVYISTTIKDRQIKK